MRTPRRATVLIADDHRIVMEGLVSLLKEDFDVVGAVGDGPSLLESARILRPEVVVTDISMPGLSGLDVLSRIREDHPTCKIIVLTMHDDAEMAARALRDGASGFLLKQAAGEELVTAIREALQGHVYLSPALTRNVMARMAAPVPEGGAQLTPRQREVLRLIAEGHRMKEIAAILDLSTRTVETHKYEMMQALGLHSTAELVRYAIQHRLISV
jgi:DNA-binding NarL/FixJ family response regulator